MNRQLTAALALLVAGIGGVTPALAQEQVCEFDFERLEYRCYIVITGTPGGPQVVDHVISEHLPLIWQRIISNGFPGAEFYCVREYQGTDDDGQPITVRETGTPWVTLIIDARTGELVNSDTGCEWPGEEPPTPPPPPPTPDQVIEGHAEALTINSQLSPDPAFGGITGLDTWLWCSAPGTTDLAVGPLNGWTVAATVDPVAYTWQIDGAATAQHSTDTCGSEPDLHTGTGAAWTWQPQVIGDYTIVISTTWSGTWALTYEGVDVGVFPFDPVTLPGEPVAYTVDEYRGSLSPPDPP